MTSAPNAVLDLVERFDSQLEAYRSGRYAGAEEIEDDGISFEEKMGELSAELYDQTAEGEQLDAAIRQNLEALGYGE